MDQLLQQTSQNMQKILQVLQQDLATVRTGRATPSLVENVEVTVYGGSARMRVVEVATIATTDAHTLTITPFDKTIIEEIARGIQEANIGYNPASDGTVIRINIPPLSEERRKELIQLMKQKLENGRIMVRQARQDALHELKKDESLSEDDRHRFEKEIQRVTDEFMGKIDGMGEAKEKELMQI